MKRSELLTRLGFIPPEACRVRVIIDTDAKNEADDDFAILHHLLTPQFDVRGICAAHFAVKAAQRGQSPDSMERSYQEVRRLLDAAGIDDVPVLRGCEAPFSSPEDTPDSEAVRFIIAEALRDDPAPLYIAALGATTNIAAALYHAPEIASRITVLWNGGGPYPAGRPEFNVQQDPIACRILLDSSCGIWQIPQDVYARFEVSLAELALRIRSCGEAGQYLFRQLMEEYPSEYNPRFPLRTGGNWTLGDNTTAAVLLENGFRGHWTLRPAPVLLPDLTYGEAPDRKPIRVYHDLDVRFALEDLYAKLALVYPQ